MSDVRSDLKYTKTHEWAKLEDDGTISVGITEHAQSLLGDIVFIELPEVDLELKAGDEVGVVESVKAASDIYIPISGTVIAINEELNDKPELLNQDPQQDGWIFKVAPSHEGELEDLLDSEQYGAQIDEE